MPYQAPPTLHEDLDELERLLRAERHPERKRRLHALVLFKREPAITRQQVAGHVAVHPNTVARWLRLYDRGGLAGLSEQHKRGPEPGQRALPGPVFAALQRRLQQQEGFSGFDKIQRWLAEEFGIIDWNRSV